MIRGMTRTYVGAGLLLVIVLAAGYFFFPFRASAPAASPRLTDDLYPLYGGVAWQAPQNATQRIGDTTLRGVGVISQPVTGTMDPSSVFSPFERIYDAQLKSLGWKVDNAFAAGGHTGGETGYRKGSEVALVGFTIVYHTVSDTSPSECPCDVTLALFSGSEQ
jgi:hypothetical protein